MRRLALPVPGALARYRPLPLCGAHLALFTSHSPTTLDVTIATLDHPEQAPADRHIWVTSRLPWLHLDSHLPEEDQERID